MTAPGPPHTDVLDPLDWRVFAREHWDRRPVVLRPAGPGTAPFDRNEVFESAVVAAQFAETAARAELTVGSRLLTDPGDLLPLQEDGSFARYDLRLAGQTGGQPFALAVHALHAGHHPLWARERSFLAGLWDAVGRPHAGVSTVLSHGTREPVFPADAARDARFVCLLTGRRHLRVTDGDGNTSVTAPVPGDLLYLPPRHHWAADPAPRPVTTVRIGVPRAPHPHCPPPDPQEPARAGRPGGDDILVRDDGEAAGGLPAVLAEALDAFRLAARPAATERRLAREALRHATDGGLRPVPPAARPGWFTDDDAVRAVERILWAPGAGRRLVAACGHVTESDLSEAELTAVLGLLNAGRPVAMVELTPPARNLLSVLAGFRAIERL
ncbi:hypothetical protein [Streptomyces sp. NPDC050145]|uniref:hypothetical protein n=1 Tax=Streptomyces sp. NPDC050145 TaxID=3365602 RepID=UPI0037899574